MIKTDIFKLMIDYPTIANVFGGYDETNNE